MSGQAILPGLAQEAVDTETAAREGVTPATPAAPVAKKRYQARAHALSLHTPVYDDPGAAHQAELFYLQKQIQSQTPMVIVMEDGEMITGAIEWYDRHVLKVRGRSRMLIYKSAIKFMYKQGENG